VQIKSILLKAYDYSSVLTLIWVFENHGKSLLVMFCNTFFYLSNVLYFIILYFWENL